MKYSILTAYFLVSSFAYSFLPCEHPEFERCIKEYAVSVIEKSPNIGVFSQTEELFPQTSVTLSVKDVAGPFYLFIIQRAESMTAMGATGYESFSQDEYGLLIASKEHMTEILWDTNLPQSKIAFDEKHVYLKIGDGYIKYSRDLKFRETKLPSHRFLKNFYANGISDDHIAEVCSYFFFVFDNLSKQAFKEYHQHIYGYIAAMNRKSDQLVKNPKELKTFLQEVRVCFDDSGPFYQSSSDFTGLLSILNSPFADEKKMARLVNDLGFYFYKAGSLYELAESLINKSLTLDKERSVAYLNLADLYYKKAHYVKALEMYRKYLSKLKKSQRQAKWVAERMAVINKMKIQPIKIHSIAINKIYYLPIARHDNH
ncbi:MAG: hypothetical protein HRU19_02810 [Pseudobacteriovorax sp.]|nr:hypothetical protein [Pseudobacteriovorax sp.]